MPALDTVLEPDIVYSDEHIRQLYFSFSKELLRSKPKFAMPHILGIIVWTRTADVASMKKFLNWYFWGDGLYYMAKVPSIKMWIGHGRMYDRWRTLCGIVSPDEIICTNKPFSFFAEYYLNRMPNRKRVSGYNQSKERKKKIWNDFYNNLIKK